MANAGSNLAGVLVEQGVLTDEQITAALKHQKQTGSGLVPAVLDLGLATEEQVVRAVAADAGGKFVDPVLHAPDPEAARLIDGVLARRHTVIPIAQRGNKLAVAMRDPDSVAAREELALVTGLDIEGIYATRTAILEAADHAYGPAPDRPVAAPAPTVQRAPESPSGSQERVGRRLGMDEEDVPLDLHQLLEIVKDREASDLHLTAGLPPMIRLHGDLMPLEQFPVLTPVVLQKALYGVLTQRQRERFETDMDLDFSYSVPGVARFRGNVYLQRGVLGAVFRLIPFLVRTIQDLGLPAQAADFARLPRGLVLVTGPTGSGKSTSLAAIIDIINSTRPVHIMTIEEPIEFLHKHKMAIVNQREVGEDVRGFAEALRHVLRQDPDVILVGEMRDLETIQMALRAAETGHLVFATLHTQDAPQTIDRIIDVFPPNQQQQIRVQLAGTLMAVVAQQLIPTHDHKGRVAACEVLIGTPAVRNLIREGKTHQIYSIMQAGSQHGMQTMDASLASLVTLGRIDHKDALERAHNAAEFAAMLQGPGVGASAASAASRRPRVIG